MVDFSAPGELRTVSSTMAARIDEQVRRVPVSCMSLRRQRPAVVYVTTTKIERIPRCGQGRYLWIRLGRPLKATSCGWRSREVISREGKSASQPLEGKARCLAEDGFSCDFNGI